MISEITEVSKSSPRRFRRNLEEAMTRIRRKRDRQEAKLAELKVTAKRVRYLQRQADIKWDRAEEEMRKAEALRDEYGIFVLPLFFRLIWAVKMSVGISQDRLAAVCLLKLVSGKISEAPKEKGVKIPEPKSLSGKIKALRNQLVELESQASQARETLNTLVIQREVEKEKRRDEEIEEVMERLRIA